jgi:iron complex transport system substrate-binding protein
MRVVTLLPAATEIVCAVGAEHLLAGISHECDWPPTITALPRVTWTPLDASGTSGEIDRAVRELRGRGRPVIAVDAERLRALRPDLLVTQDLCEVCAVADGEVHRVAEVLSPAPEVLALQARTLDGIFRDIERVGRALDLAPEADEVVAGMRYRFRRLRRTAPATPPRVLCVEWLDPIYLAGHWVPELVAAAGGVDVGAEPGDPSVRREPGELAALRPDVVLIMLCGFTVERARAEYERAPLPELGVPVRFVDGNAYTSRPGPRVVDGAEKIRDQAP